MKELQHFIVTVLLLTTISRHCASTDFYCQPGGPGTDTLHIQAVCNPSVNSARVSWTTPLWLAEIIIKYSCNGSQYNAVPGININASPMEINDLVPGMLCSFMICYIASTGPVGFIQDPNQASCIAGGEIPGPTKATSIVSASKSIKKSTTLMSSSDLDVLLTVFSSSQLFASSQLLSSQLPATAASINTTTTTATPPITYSNLYGFSIVSSKTQLISNSPSSTSDTGVQVSEFTIIIIVYIIVALFVVVLVLATVPIIIALSAFAFKKTRYKTLTNKNGRDLPEEDQITAGGLRQKAVFQDTLAMRPPFDEKAKDDEYIMPSPAGYII